MAKKDKYRTRKTSSKPKEEEEEEEGGKRSEQKINILFLLYFDCFSIRKKMGETYLNRVVVIKMV